MAKGVTKPAVAVTMASVIQPAVSVCVHQAGLDPTVQQVSVRSHQMISSCLQKIKKGYTFLSECPAGFYGPDCHQRCLCQNSATCNKSNGICTCASGWTGAACELGKCHRCCWCMWPHIFFNLSPPNTLLQSVVLGPVQAPAKEICRPAAEMCFKFAGTDIKQITALSKNVTVQLFLFCVVWHHTDFSLCSCLFCGTFTECVAGRFGADCQQQCDCENSGQCDRQTGQCSCSAGWVGARCEKGECLMH